MEDKVDVLISGAGPVGLIIALQLRRLGISVAIIDAADKASPYFPMYGRACSLQPRTMEMMDQLDLWDEIAQQALTVHSSVTLKDGELVQGRGWAAVENIQGTFFNFLGNLRLYYLEKIFRRRIAELGPKVQAPVRLVGLSLDEAESEYKVVSRCAGPDGKTFEIRSKYIIGCDGAGSAVRKLAQIPFNGAEKEQHWVRIDGVVKTNFPESRIGLGAIESPTHGQTLWAALDHGATRIGYVLSPEMYEKYGRHMKQEDAVKEAKAALAPFELDFETVDWHTVYVVKQFVAERFQDRERILLAGDSAHSHSSGTAQGMNTGIHDAVSLAWRLAGVLNGAYKPEVLANYSDERRAIAQHLISNDETIASLISGIKPPMYKDRTESPMVLLNQFLESEVAFTMGTGISYPSSLLNDVEKSYPPINCIPGHIAPDVMLHKPGFRKGLQTRLQEVTKYDGKFHILVFSGDVHLTQPLLRTLREDVDREAERFQHAIEFRTLILGGSNAYAEYLGCEQFGYAYYDVDGTAHNRYKVSHETGVVAVVRPDGILGFVAPLDRFDKIIAYLERIVVPREVEVRTNGTNGDIGQMIVPDENNLYYKMSKAQDVPQSTEQGAVNPQKA